MYSRRLSPFLLQTLKAFLLQLEQREDIPLNWYLFSLHYMVTRMNISTNIEKTSHLIFWVSNSAVLGIMGDCSKSCRETRTGIWNSWSNCTVVSDPIRISFPYFVFLKKIYKLHEDKFIPASMIIVMVFCMPLQINQEALMWRSCLGFWTQNRLSVAVCFAANPRNALRWGRLSWSLSLT